MFGTGAGKISGKTFKKMVMKAHGHHATMTHDVRKAIDDLHAHQYIRDNAKVDKTKATKIMKALKEKGLTHHMIKSPTEYVHHEFRQEAARLDAIKRENLAARKAEVAKEHQAELAKKADAGGKSKPKPMTTPKMVSHVAAVASVQKAPTQDTHTATTRPLMPTSNNLHHSTPTVSAPTPQPTVIKPGSISIQKQTEADIDLAID